MLLAVSDRHGQIVELDEAVLGAEADLTETVHWIYWLLAEAFTGEPRVAPAMLAEDSPARRIRDSPLPLQIHQMITPVATHSMPRPASANAPEVDVPELDEACTMFADAFLRGAPTGDAETHRR